MGPRDSLLGICGFLFILGAVRDCVANPFDTFGYGARGIAMGGAMTAAAESFDACYYNPAGLASVHQVTIGAGLFAYRPYLYANGAGSSENSLHALVDIGFASGVALGSLKDLLHVGIVVAFPTGPIYSIDARPASAAYFPLLENRNRRLVAAAGFAISPLDWLSIGAGILVLPRVRGKVGVDLTKGETGNSLKVDVDLNVAPGAGLVLRPLPGLLLGFSWRGRNSTHVTVPTAVKVSDKLATIRLEVLATEYFTPHEFSLGASYRLPFGLTFAADMTYFLYREFQVPAPDVYLLDSKGSISKASVPKARDMKDAIAVRLGTELKVGGDWSLRAGYAYFSSPFPEQTGVTNLLDGDRHSLVGGGGWKGDVGFADLRADLFAGYSYVARRAHEKLVFLPENPGFPGIESKGGILYFGGGVSLDF